MLERSLDRSTQRRPAARAGRRCDRSHRSAVALPAGRLTSAELAAPLGIGEEWILSAAPGSGSAARRAGRAAERLRRPLPARPRSTGPASAPDELDLVIVATITRTS